MARILSFQYVFVRRSVFLGYISDPPYMLCGTAPAPLALRSSIDHRGRILVRCDRQPPVGLERLELYCAPSQSSRSGLSSLHAHMVSALHPRRYDMRSLLPPVSYRIAAKILKTVGLRHRFSASAPYFTITYCFLRAIILRAAAASAAVATAPATRLPVRMVLPCFCTNSCLAAAFFSSLRTSPSRVSGR